MGKSARGLISLKRQRVPLDVLLAVCIMCMTMLALITKCAARFLKRTTNKKCTFNLATHIRIKKFRWYLSRINIMMDPLLPLQMKSPATYDLWQFVFCCSATVLAILLGKQVISYHSQWPIWEPSSLCLYFASCSLISRHGTPSDDDEILLGTLPATLYLQGWEMT